MRKSLQAVALVGALLLGYTLHALPERQPHMEAALRALQNAEEQLNKAEHDKGGHREKALDHVRAAIAEVKEGIGYDRK